MPSSGRRLRPPSRAEALDLGAAALTFLAVDPGQLARFLEATGMATDDLRRGAQSPDVLAAVLDYLCHDESLLLVFAAQAGKEAAAVEPARAVLAGEIPAGGGRR